MKKRWVLSMVGCMLLLSACGSQSEKTISGEVQNSNQQVQLEESQEIAKEADVENAGTSEEKKKGYVCSYQGVDIAVDEDMSSVSESLGEPVSYFEATSCAFEGLDKIYTYSGFEIDTYPEGEIDKISAITFIDDSIMTPEGIGIGDSQDKVKEIQGADFAESENLYIYEKNNMKLKFIFENESVVSVVYSSTVLE